MTNREIEEHAIGIIVYVIICAINLGVIALVHAAGFSWPAAIVFTQTVGLVTLMARAAWRWAQTTDEY